MYRNPSDLITTSSRRTTTSRSEQVGYSSSWLTFLHNWAKLKNDIGRFAYHNPDLMICTEHVKIQLKMRVPGVQYNSLCNLCPVRSFEDTTIAFDETLEEAASRWRNAYDAWTEHKVPTEHMYIAEQKNWINYQHHCWEYALKMRRKQEISPAIRKLLLQHIRDNRERHKDNFCKIYCVTHQQLGEMLPLRPLNSYMECMACTKVVRGAPMNLFHTVPPTKDFSLHGSVHKA